jgi:sugar lactone lactonase YvrE
MKRFAWFLALCGACGSSSKLTDDRDPRGDEELDASSLDAGVGPGEAGAPMPADGGVLPDGNPPGEPDDAGEERPPVDCNALPDGPFETRRVGDMVPTEDIAFDEDGYMYWTEASGLYKMRAGQKPELVAPGVTAYGALEFGPTGELFAQLEHSIVRVLPNGSTATVLDGLMVPNGLEFDPLGRMYITEISGARVVMYDPKSEKTSLISDQIISPNGITFSPAFDFLYVSSYGGMPGRVVLYRIAIDAKGKPGPTEEWVKDVGSGVNEGMAVDECGNVYVSDSFGLGAIFRITPDGSKHTTVVSRPNETLHNLQWGHGKGWSKDKLYIVSLYTGVFEVDMGVRSKKYW